MIGLGCIARHLNERPRKTRGLKLRRKLLVLVLQSSIEFIPHKRHKTIDISAGNHVHFVMLKQTFFFAAYCTPSKASRQFQHQSHVDYLKVQVHSVHFYH